MGVFSLLQTIWSTDLAELSQVARIEIKDGATPRLLICDPSSGQWVDLALGGDTLNLAQAQRSTMAGAQQEFELNGRTRMLDSVTLATLQGSNGSTSTYLDGTGFAGNLASVHRGTFQGKDYLYLAEQKGGGLSVYRVESTGALSRVQSLGDTDALYLRNVVGIDSVELAGKTYVVAASGGENGLTVFEQISGGKLRALASFGFADQLPINQPSAVKTVVMGDHAFVLLSSFASSSLTVLELGAGGTLRFVDQVNDTLDTRFYRVAAMDAITYDGQTLVAVAGTDGGLSLFQMLPSGRLIHRETLEDDLSTALRHVSQLRFVPANGRLELLALATGDQGLTRLALDAGPTGMTSEGPSGAWKNDVLTAPAAGGAIDGRRGDDILIDGPGSDTLTGSGGADVFVFMPDGVTDTITDFNIRYDRIDLSGFPLHHTADDFEITTLSDGLVLRWLDETLIIHTSDGNPLDPDALDHRILFDSDHVIMPDPMPTMGTDGNDVFLWNNGPETVDGGAGFDTRDYLSAPTAVTVNLGDSRQNARAASGDVLSNVEALCGTAGDDILIGDDLGNTLRGRAGNDRLEGAGGNDWIEPGTGNDSVDGGQGSDMVSFSDYTSFVRVNLSAGTAQSGGWVDTLISIENVTGTIYGDVIQGDDGDNRLRGLGDYDWFIGSGGSDSYDGGSGRDMISYVYAPGPVTVDLGAGRGLAGQALGDTYTSIERVTGSIYADLFYGSDGEDEFRGLGDFDWFVGSGGGKDRYDGGSGMDTVVYWNATSGVSASLLLGRGTGGEAARDIYISIENLGGSNYDDSLTGDNGRNYLRGYYGRDTLIGAGGVDRLDGGPSDDFLDGGTGWDYAIYHGARSNYSIVTDGDITTVTALSGNEGVDTLINVEALQFTDDLVFL